MDSVPKKLALIAVLMVLAYLAFAFSIEYAKDHPIVDQPSSSPADP